MLQRTAYKVIVMNKKEYKEYLKSEHWKQLSHRIKQDRGKCEECSKEHNLNVHHLIYERIGQELDTDLIVLCKWCHNLRHYKIKKITKMKTLKVPNIKKGEVKWKRKVKRYSKLQRKEHKSNRSIFNKNRQSIFELL